MAGPTYNKQLQEIGNDYLKQVVYQQALRDLEADSRVHHTLSA